MGCLQFARQYGQLAMCKQIKIAIPACNLIPHYVWQNVARLAMWL